MTEGRVLLSALRLTNFLSYGPDSEEVELAPLNVIIGPNLSGKSNLIESLSILRATPRDLGAPIREGGGIGEWLWKGSIQGSRSTPIAEISAILQYPAAPQPIRYRLAFSMVGQRMELVDEAVENKDRTHHWEQDVYFFYRYQHGRPVLNVQAPSQDAETSPQSGFYTRHLAREDLDLQQSVLSQRKDPDQYPELTYVGSQFSKIALYREWDLGRYTPPRLPQKADLPQDFLLEDASNLTLVLNALEHQGVKRELMSRLKQFSRTIEDFTTKIEGGTVQLFLHEHGLANPIPATRLSDGTLRFLCLLAILCHPAPPPLVCIEEPELSLHPDALKIIGELLKQASQRTQLVITTHSEALVSQLTDMPESVLVCERDEKGTRLSRLDPARLDAWLKKYGLGELWRMGEIGGNP